jgi:dihydroorotase
MIGKWIATNRHAVRADAAPGRMQRMLWKLLMMTGCTLLAYAQPYDLLIRGGRVIDPKNGLDAVADVVVPGLIDIHVHLYPGKGGKGAYSDLGVPPDAFSFRSGVTTMVDAGTAGWRNFADFRQRVIDHAQTRVLAFVNIYGPGMGDWPETDPAEMQPERAAEVARENPGIVVGFKTAHYFGPGWPSVEAAVKAGELVHLPVMVDFGWLDDPQRNIQRLFLEKLRPGDIFTHCYSGHREELLADGTLNPAMVAGRKRGIIFDLGHGGGSFYWKVAVPATRAGFWPDSISTDLHTGSMNGGMKDFTETMSKLLILGAPLPRVIAMSTWNPAREIHHEELGHLSAGAVADVTLLRVEEGRFGFLDSAGARFDGTRRILAEVTIKGGQVMWDRNGRAAADWKGFPYPTREPPPAK